VEIQASRFLAGPPGPSSGKTLLVLSDEADIFAAKLNALCSAPLLHASRANELEIKKTLDAGLAYIEQRIDERCAAIDRSDAQRALRPEDLDWVLTLAMQVSALEERLRALEPS
jgi:hypothetical protein